MSTSELFVPQFGTDFATQGAPAAVSKEDEALSALKRYLQTHPNAATGLEHREKQLRDIVLHAAEGGLLDAMRKAFAVLERMYETHPAWPSPITAQVGSRPPLDICRAPAGALQISLTIK